MLYKRRKKGFTLIELLVVIAIIAILAAILFPVFAQAREKSRQSACLSNLKQMGTAWLQYLQDYDEYTLLWKNMNTGARWFEIMAPYLNSGGRQGPAYACPSNAYRYGASVYSSVNYLYNPSVNENNSARVKYSNMSEPARVIVFSDGYANLAEAITDSYCNGDCTILSYYTSGSGWTDRFPSWGSTYWDDTHWTNISMLHQGFANFAWADGHVSVLNSKQLEANWQKYLFWTNW